MVSRILASWKLFHSVHGPWPNIFWEHWAAVCDWAAGSMPTNFKNLHSPHPLTHPAPSPDTTRTARATLSGMTCLWVTKEKLFSMSTQCKAKLLAGNSIRRQWDCIEKLKSSVWIQVSTFVIIEHAEYQAVQGCTELSGFSKGILGRERGIAHLWA